MTHAALVRWQADMALAALQGDGPARERLLAQLENGPLPLLEVLELHAVTVHHALHAALAQRVPTLVALVGAESFRGMARVFAQQHPPSEPQLAQWGAALPAFIAAYPDYARLAYLPEVAAFDLALDAVAMAVPGRWSSPVTLTGELQLQWTDSLQCLQAQYPVDLLREAVSAEHAGDDGALARVELLVAPRDYALWCSIDATVQCQPVSAVAAAFLTGLMASAEVEQALAAALAAAAPGEMPAAAPAVFANLLRELQTLRAVHFTAAAPPSIPVVSRGAKARPLKR